MDIRAHDGALYEWEGDVLALGVFEENLTRSEENKFLHPGLAELDYVMGGVLGELVCVQRPHLQIFICFCVLQEWFTTLRFIFVLDFCNRAEGFCE